MPLKNESSFSRKDRLTTKAEFTAVFEKSKKLSQSWFLALYIQNQKAYPRLGMVISKRIVKKASSRNYIKRLIREGFRASKSKLGAVDLVILTRRGCTTLDKPRLHKEIDNLWQQLIERSPKPCSS